MIEVKQFGPWYVPASDEECFAAIFPQSKDIDTKWMPHISDRSICVQAGGNVGIFPHRLAKFFDRVYTFEPDAANFLCMAMNCVEENVFKFQAALGEAPGFMGMHLFPKNVGAHYMEGDGPIPVMTVDGLGLPSCGLIAADVEGAELPLLKGAEQTILKYRPVLIIEEKNHGVRFGYRKDELYDWLKERGYEKVGDCWRDGIWKYRSST